MKVSLSLFVLAQTAYLSAAFVSPPPSAASLSSELSELQAMMSNGEIDSSSTSSSRRRFFQLLPETLLVAPFAASLVQAATPLSAQAYTPTTASDGNLPDLPPEAVRSYLQYRIALQIAADFYIFDLQTMIPDIDTWGEIAQIFRVNNNKGQGQPSRIERDFINPMRIILLSMPPDYADDMRTAQFKFESAMNSISKATAGYRRDLPVELDKGAVEKAVVGWEAGRVAYNEFLVLLNDISGLNEISLIPPAGPNQTQEYGRSMRRYNDLVKKTKLCQNRGGPALSSAWGGLMVSGYLQDSCGIPDLDDYFYQSKA
jgi:hypothetical protein